MSCTQGPTMAIRAAAATPVVSMCCCALVTHRAAPHGLDRRGHLHGMGRHFTSRCAHASSVTGAGVAQLCKHATGHPQPLHHMRAGHSVLTKSQVLDSLKMFFPHITAREVRSLVGSGNLSMDKLKELLFETETPVSLLLTILKQQKCTALSMGQGRAAVYSTSAASCRTPHWQHQQYSLLVALPGVTPATLLILSALDRPTLPKHAPYFSMHVCTVGACR